MLYSNRSCTEMCNCRST